MIIAFAQTWPHGIPGKYDIAGVFVLADSMLGGKLLLTDPQQKPDLALMIATMLLGFSGDHQHFF